MSVIVLSNARSLQAVRNVINARARETNAPESLRRRAMSIGLSASQKGHSAAWSIAEACRVFRGLAPAMRVDYPSPPEAA